MDNQEDQFVEVKLLTVDTPSPSGNVYPREVIEKAVEALKLRHTTGALLRGECGTPRYQPGQNGLHYQMRVGSISEDRVSHVIDVATMEIKDGLLKAKVGATGPFQNVAREFLEKGQANFAMRSFVRYERGNTTQT